MTGLGIRPCTEAFCARLQTLDGSVEEATQCLSRDGERWSWQRSLVEEVNAAQHEVVQFDVGGERFHTTHSVLSRHPDSTLSVLLTKRTQDENVVVMDENYVFIDRNPQHFPLVMEYLRGGYCHVPEDLESRNSLLADATYYGLDGLRQQLERKLFDQKMAELEQLERALERERSERADEQQKHYEHEQRIQQLLMERGGAPRSGTPPRHATSGSPEPLHPALRSGDRTPTGRVTPTGRSTPTTRAGVTPTSRDETGSPRPAWSTVRPVSLHSLSGRPSSPASMPPLSGRPSSPVSMPPKVTERPVSRNSGGSPSPRGLPSPSAASRNLSSPRLTTTTSTLLQHRRTAPILPPPPPQTPPSPIPPPQTPPPPPPTAPPQLLPTRSHTPPRLPQTPPSKPSLPPALQSAVFPPQSTAASLPAAPLQPPMMPQREVRYRSSHADGGPSPTKAMDYQVPEEVPPSPIFRSPVFPSVAPSLPLGKIEEPFSRPTHPSPSYDDPIRRHPSPHHQPPRSMLSSTEELLTTSWMSLPSPGLQQELSNANGDLHRLLHTGDAKPSGLLDRDNRHDVDNEAPRWSVDSLEDFEKNVEAARAETARWVAYRAERERSRREAPSTTAGSSTGPGAPTPGGPAGPLLASPMIPEKEAALAAVAAVTAMEHEVSNNTSSNSGTNREEAGPSEEFSERIRQHRKTANDLERMFQNSMFYQPPPRANVQSPPRGRGDDVETDSGLSSELWSPGVVDEYDTQRRMSSSDPNEASFTVTSFEASVVKRWQRHFTDDP